MIVINEQRLETVSCVYNTRVFVNQLHNMPGTLP